MVRSKIYLITSILLSMWINAPAQEFTIIGKIMDSETKSPVSGATIKILGSGRGTYSSSQGKFRLPFSSSDKRLKVSSLGYESLVQNINNIKDTLVIMLKPIAFRMSNVDVNADIDANLVIRRAIARKEENKKAIKTFSGLLYSKFVIELGGSVFSKAGSDGTSLTLSASLGAKAPQSMQMFLLETFSNKFYDYDKSISHTEIIQRRQTRNIPASQNLMTIGNFVSFYDDIVPIINARITSPIANNAFDFYNYKLKGKNLLDDRYVYIVEVEPATTTYPAFSGTIKIVEGSFNIIEVDLKPSAGTSIQFVKNLEINQKFDETEDHLWYPSYLELAGEAQVDVVKSMIDVKAIARATSIYSEVKVNHSLPDSIYTKETARSISVSDNADSAKKEFWEKNSLREITPKEEQIYSKVDSLVKLDSTKERGSDFYYSILNPQVDFNRVGSLSLGLSPSLGYLQFSLQTEATYSIGQRRPFGSASLSYRFFNGFRSPFRSSLTLSAYSVLQNISMDKSFSRLYTSAFAAFLHEDYYDYCREDGWTATLNAAYQGFNLHLTYENSHQFSLNKTTNRSLFNNDKWRINPEINQGDYQLIYAGISLPYFRWLVQNLGVNARLDINALRSIAQPAEFKNFTLLYGNAFLGIPTFNSGYDRMMLNISASAGMHKNDIPVQYQYRMGTNNILASISSNDWSAPNYNYGGDGYFSVAASFNSTDLWWRALGLPLWEGRGLELIMASSASKYFSNSLSYYSHTGKHYYGEAGFGLHRIPTFISNVIYWGLDFRWGFGPLGSGRFGGGLTINLPF